MNCEKCFKTCHKTVGNYHYTESGLSNVWLVNVPVYKCDCGHTLIEIPAFMQLHEELAKIIIQKPSELNKGEIRFLRKTLHKNSKELAKLLNVDPVTVSRWETGASTIDKAYQLLLKVIILTHFNDHINTENALEKINANVKQVGRKKKIELPLPFIAHKALLQYKYDRAY